MEATPDNPPEIDVPGFRGSLQELVSRAHRGDIDVENISVSAITSAYRRKVEGPGAHPDLRDTADFLTLLARLVAIKAAAVLPSQDLTEGIDDEEPEDGEAGQRLAEYRLFKAAADALLGEDAGQGTRSFLGLVSPEVIPVERMRIAPERLAAAFRAVLERITEAEPLPVAVTFSVADKVAAIRDLLSRGPLAFEELFAGVSSRLEAVACFLALLELLKEGAATVEQEEAFGPITVSGRG